MDRLLSVTALCGFAGSYRPSERPNLGHLVVKIGRHFQKKTGSDFAQLFHAATPLGPTQ